MGNQQWAGSDLSKGPLACLQARVLGCRACASNGQEGRGGKYSRPAGRVRDPPPVRRSFPSAPSAAWHQSAGRNQKTARRRLTMRFPSVTTAGLRCRGYGFRMPPELWGALLLPLATGEHAVLLLHLCGHILACHSTICFRLRCSKSIFIDSRSSFDRDG